jgi:hypothetical protein
MMEIGMIMTGVVMYAHSLHQILNVEMAPEKIMKHVMMAIR